MVEPKVYIYCFGDIILLLKCVQEERLKKVKLLSTIDPQIIQSNAGKQFSTYKYKKAGEIISISWDYSKAIWTLIYLFWVHTILCPNKRFGKLLSVTNNYL